MKQIILGTAGHIDHGKTELIKALTGIDTDRLKEEKERGITIDLGFAFMKSSNRVNIGIIDVPGHERFVKNMLAGAGGIDLVLLVIAADEGVMPQTREHLAICQLLKIKSGLVALTKTDLIDNEWLQLMKEDVASFLKGTLLEGRPIIPVSSLTGEGIPELKIKIEELANEIEAKKTDGPFRLPIDRVFTMKGFGTVITGTVVSGKVNVEDKIEVLPKGIQGKIRGIQIHNQSSLEAIAGQRSAINIQGVDKTDIKRGDVLAHVGQLKSSLLYDATFFLLPDSPHPLKNRQKIRFHLGSGEIMAVIILLDKEELKPGEEAYVQIKLEKPVVALSGDYYVIRSYSPMITVGGGEILNANPKKYKRFDPKTLEKLKRLKEGSFEDIVEFHVFNSGLDGMSLENLYLILPLEKNKIKESIEILINKQIINTEDNKHFIHKDNLLKLKDTLIKELESFHKKFPLRPGISKEELRNKMSLINDKTYSFLINLLMSQNLIVLEKDKIRLSSFSRRLEKDQEELKKKIEKEYLLSGFKPPNPQDLFNKFSIDNKRFLELVSLLLEEGHLIKIKEQIFFHKENLSKAEDLLKDFLKKNKEITAAQFRDLLGISRKHAIPLLEYFDAKKLTLRVGDKRVFRSKL
ncbi:MAG TPA: selenocysteine-specific translation elongation factor [Nitrospinota bacterium]|nr:selenocysteine-specific translation elongation factor [Nitrospinota bacterium]